MELDVYYLDLQSDIEPWGKRTAASGEKIQERLLDVLALGNIARLVINGFRISHIDIVPEGLEGYDGAKWLHASTEVEFDNSDDESCAIHNLLANLIWARKHEIAETVAVEDIGYLWYRELRQVEDPVPYLDIDLPSSYSGTTLRFSWPLAVDSDLASICAVAKTFGKVVEEIERSQKLIFEGIEIIKTPLVQYNNYSFV